MQKENSTFLTRLPKTRKTFNDFIKHRQRFYSSNFAENQSSPMMTSTPKVKSSSKAILKENLGINSPENVTKLEQKAGLEHSKPQNREKSKRKTHRKTTKATFDEKREAKRRQKAVEAMQIQENRRIRLAKEKLNAELVDDDLEKLSMNEAARIEKSPDTEKRKEAKLIKEKRILEFLAEQEARKKHVKSPQLMTPSMSFKPVKVKPRRVLFNLPNENSTQFLKFQQPLIKYSLDEIRSLNPYGYYFM